MENFEFHVTVVILVQTLKLFEKFDIIHALNFTARMPYEKAYYFEEELRRFSIKKDTP